LTLSKTLTSCLIKQTISKEVAVVNIRTLLPHQGPSLYQKESWDQKSKECLKTLTTTINPTKPVTPDPQPDQDTF